MVHRTGRASSIPENLQSLQDQVEKPAPLLFIAIKIENILRQILNTLSQIENPEIIRHLLDSSKREAVMFGVEYMSQGSLGGDLQSLSIRSIQKDLSQLARTYPENPEFQRAVKEFSFAHQIAIWNMFPLQQLFIAKRVQTKIASLQQNEAIILPTGYSSFQDGGHAVMARIVCTQTVPRQYSFTVYNEGEGLSYHQQYERGYYESSCTWKNLTEKNLSCSFFSKLFFMQTPLSNSSIDTLYSLFNTLGEKVSYPRNHISKTKTRGQKGGSCPAQSALSVARGVLSHEGYLRLKSHQRHKYLYTLFKKIELGSSDPEVPLIALELAGKIDKNRNKIGSLPQFSDLNIIKEKLVEKIRKQSALKQKHASNPKRAISAFFKGNKKVVSTMSPETVKKLLVKIKGRPCTKSQWTLLYNRAVELNIPVDHELRHRFSTR